MQDHKLIPQLIVMYYMTFYDERDVTWRKHDHMRARGVTRNAICETATAVKVGQSKNGP